MQQVTALHERFVADAKSFVHAGSATWWGSAQVRVRPERRYHKNSETYSVVQTASAEVRVKFRDFQALADWFERAGSVAGVTVAGIEWTVTEEHRRQVEREVRVQAVQDATRRAEAYAGAIGGDGVALQALFEPGLRPNAGGAAAGGFVSRAVTASAHQSSMELRPDDIEIGAEVTADFLVTGVQ